MVRMADGRYMPAQTTFSTRANVPKKFLVVLQYWEGDKAQTEELASLIADLERIRNTSVDVMLFRRYDASEISRTIISKLEAKFGKVMQVKCRRTAKGYPYGANAMFYDLVALLAQFAPYNVEYNAFINVESDCCPTQAGWIGKLWQDWKDAEMQGHACIGHIQENPVRHLNGVGVYAIDMWKRVPASKLNGGAPHIAYDIDHANDILPFARDTKLIRLNFQCPTITADALFSSGAVLYHGVKDGSARAAVRAKHIAHSDEKEYESRTVFTFFHPTVDNPIEQKAILSLWEQGWRSQGWNPVVLTLRDAIAHGKYNEVNANIERFPTAKNKLAMRNRWMRWLALDTVGGGLMSEYDVIPANFPPDKLHEPVVLGAGASLVAVRGEQLKALIHQIATYTPQPEDVLDGRAHVDEAKIVEAFFTDHDEAVVAFGTQRTDIPKLVHFAQRFIDKSYASGQRKSALMERFLRGEIS